MKPTDLEKLFKEMRTEAPSRLDLRVYSTLDNATKQTVHSLSLWRKIMRSPITRIAVAAVFIVGCLFLARYLKGGDSPSMQKPNMVKNVEPASSAEDQLENTRQKELALAQTLYQEKDLPGLLALLETGQEATRLKIAEFLRKIGDESVIPALQRLADTWQGDGENPFKKAIDGIIIRLNEPVSEPNAVVSEKTVPMEPHDDVTNANSQMPMGIAGMVVDKMNGSPIRNAEVCLSLDDPGKSTFTYKDGSFELLVEKPSQRSIYIIAQGYASQRILTLVEKGKVTSDLLIRMDFGCRVAGIVADSKGNPISGAEVEIFPFFANRSVVTHTNGYYEIEGLNPWVAYYLEIRHADYPASQQSFRPRAVGETVIQDIILEPGVDVVGQATDSQGNLLSGVRIGSTWNSIQVKTDSQGRYRLHNVKQGELTLWAVHPDYGLLVETVELDKGITQKQVELKLPNAIPLRGQIVNVFGEAVAGVSVYVSGYNDVYNIADDYRSITDENGRFVISNTPAQGFVMLDVYGDKISRITVTIELTGESTEYVIPVGQERVGCIYGQVVDDVTGDPISRFTVKLAESKVGKSKGGVSWPWDSRGFSFSSAQGYFDTSVMVLR